MKRQTKKKFFGISNPFRKQQRLPEQSQRGNAQAYQVHGIANQDEDNLERDAVIPDNREVKIKELLVSLKYTGVNAIVLYGEHGVGKTWIAKVLTVRAIKEGVFDVSIWVYLNRRYKDSVTLYKSIARQLYLQLDPAGAECYLNEIDDEDADETEKKLLEFFKQKLEKKKCLLVLDDDGSVMSEQMVMPMLEKILDFADKERSKILITRIKKDMDNDTEDDISCSTEYEEIKPLSQRESESLLRERIQINDHLIDDVQLAEIASKCKGLPTGIIFAATAFRYVLKNESDDMLIKLAVQEAAKLVDEYWTVARSSNYQRFRNSTMMQRCFWCSKIYLEELGSIHYNELILYWILEGCFSETTSEKAYIEGHKVLMDLFDVGLLGQREAGEVIMERAAVHFANYWFSSLCEKTHHGFLLNPLNSKSLGIVKHMSDKVVALKRSSNEQIHLSALLIDGNYFSSDDQDRIFQLSEKLLLLSISNLQRDISVPRIPELRVLILRDCNSCSSINALKELKKLTALEISGAKALEEIPDDFLASFPNLEYLNLSGLSIQYFPRPSSASALSKLRSLILRRCTKLEYFPDVKGLVELEVLDLSGATSLAFLNRRYEKFEGVPELKMLDLSETNIYEFPSLDEVKSLTCLLLKRCPLLNKLKSLTTLSHLEVIDTSGSGNLHRIRPISLPPGDFLRRIDLSGTMVPTIPPLKNAVNLIYLYLRNCPNLKELPVIQGAKSLLVIDLSGSKELENIEATFEEMSSLQDLYLSETKIKTLPSLSGLRKLQKIVLSSCESLISLPEMRMLSSLQVLDLSGCTALTSLPDEPFSQMPNLASLNLSGTCFSQDNISDTILQCVGSGITFSKPQESTAQTQQAD